jgi:tetratricopeptide (TPR) repeat protein
MGASLSNLAGLYQGQRKYAEAEPLQKSALAITERALGKHPDVATSLNSLASLYFAQGRRVEAEPLFKRALAIRTEVLAANHPHLTVSSIILRSFTSIRDAMLRLCRLSALNSHYGEEDAGPQRCSGGERSEKLGARP